MNADILPPQRTSTEPPRRDDRDVRLAWVCVAASPVAFVVAFVVGEGTSTVLGYDGTGIAPWWILIVTLVLALAVFCVPAALATWFWQRGAGPGRRPREAPGRHPDHPLGRVPRDEPAGAARRHADGARLTPARRAGAVSGRRGSPRAGRP